MTLVRISAKSARLMFTECGPACIEQNGCNGNCCDAPSKPSGCMVSIHESERERIERYGVDVRGGFIIPAEGARGCPFKRQGLCILHGTPDKPFGCIASPFTLNANDTLIIRNRYKLLPCYRGPGAKAPAYLVFRSSLDAIFGWDMAQRISDELTYRVPDDDRDISVDALPHAYTMLKDNDAAKRRLKESENA
jgi:hypothetical protein